jgi:NAD(P)-dependent dehydrogenase (short-subunit alcohol dehydrogenase family)
MTIALDDLVILVTGAAGGIGREICRGLKAANAIVIATDLASTPELSADLFLSHDVTKPEDWEHVAETVTHQYGRLDCLVNGAGISVVAGIENTSLAEWRRVQSVNAESVFLSLQAMLPLLKKGGLARKSGASVVNISSIGGLRGAAFNAAYCASKAAVQNLSKSAAIEFGMMGYNIRVNSVHPGGIETPMLHSIIQTYVDMGASPSYEAAHAAVVASHPIGRMGEPSEISGGVVYLCSDAASFVTGSELIIDGAFTAK